MPKFIISSADPVLYKQQIFDFWKDYLPGTPEGRFDWLLSNPAGPVIWYFAFDEKTKTLAGVVSVLPQNFYLAGQQIKAGIIGDFMVQRNYRVFGPTLNLLKEALATVDQGVFDFVYTLPNPQSTKLATHVGLKPLAPLHHLVKPSHFNFLLEKYVGGSGANLLDKILVPLFQIFSRETYVSTDGTFAEIDWSDDSLNQFCQKMKELKPDSLMGDCCSDYLEWKYRLNPERVTHIFIYRSNKTKEIQGYCAYCLDSDILDIYDIGFMDQHSFLNILNKIAKIAKLNNCKGTYLLTNLDNKLFCDLKKDLYLDRGKHADVFTYPERKDLFENWDFLSAYRNS